MLLQRSTKLANKQNAINEATLATQLQSSHDSHKSFAKLVRVLLFKPSRIQ